ncbi:MAG: acyl-CoA dehydrogenase family protein [Rhodobacteraceae bacterium]|nr:acyl-CoA dehydrogenase family protein [Paracoccaceae bacterium]
MIPFTAPVDDILFSLEHVAGAHRLPDWDGALSAEIVRHFASFAEGVIAPLDEPGDVQGCRLEAGRVRMPDGFAVAYAAYAEQGWPGLSLPEAQGGQGMSGPVLGAVSEIFTGACHALQMVTSLAPGAARTILAFGTADQQARFLPLFASGEWLATMCLTEPGAGSDLGAIRTRATPDGDLWRIDGEKIFISGGDQDMSEGILHLVLARTGDGAGTRGLSLFLCPSEIDGARNGVSVARIEEKLGLHASPTCQMVFDGARAEMIGAPGEGLKAMFTMMNHARLDVALQGVAHAARAAQIARAYAADRRQGQGPDGNPAMLADHPDVQRMLDEQDMLAIGARAMCHLALVALESGEDRALVDFLTPLCKIYATEAGIRSADLGIQVLGGYGYLREYRVEQVWRDARITAIYEGTNGIHALTLATRMLAKGGAPAQAFAARIREIDAGTGRLATGLARWCDFRDRLASDPAAAVKKARAFADATAALYVQAVWTILADRADAAPDPARIRRLAALAGVTGTAAAALAPAG